MYAMDPSSAREQPSCSWLHALEPELLSSAAGVRKHKSSGPAALLQWWNADMRTHTPWALQELALDIGSSQQLPPGFPGLPVSWHTDATLVFQLVSQE